MQLAETRNRYLNITTSLTNSWRRDYIKKYYSDLPFEDFAERVGFTGERITTPKETTLTSGYTEERGGASTCALAQSDPGILYYKNSKKRYFASGAVGMTESAALGAATLLDEEAETGVRDSIKEFVDPIQNILLQMREKAGGYRNT